MKMHENIKLGIIGLAFWCAIGIVFRNITEAFKFGVGYWYLFFFPMLGWTVNLEMEWLEKFIICNILGLVIAPTIWFILNMTGIPLSLLTYILTPFLIFLSGIAFSINFKNHLNFLSDDVKKKSKESKKSSGKRNM